MSERLAEDERLRGDLTDDGFGPVLNLVTSLVPDAAERVMADPNSTSAVDEVSHDARTLTRAIVDAAESGNVDGLVKLLAEPILTAASADRACTAITNEQTWPDSPDQRARRIVEILLAAIEEER